jgi:arsenate reductase-like glutaredoxin family protein
MERTKIYYLHRGDNVPFYIGKSRKHLERLENHKQTYGHDIKMEIISEVKDWKRWEKYYIEKYKKLGYKLENKNKGGGGPSFASEQMIEKIKNHPTRGKKISMSNKGKINPNKGKPFSEEHKSKIKATRSFLKNRKNTWQNEPVLQYDLDGNFLREFASQTEAVYFVNAKGDGVGACCRGKQKTAYGYIWKFKNNLKTNNN